MFNTDSYSEAAVTENNEQVCDTLPHRGHTYRVANGIVATL